MISFEMTEQQQALRESARKFSRDVIRPVAGHHDKTEEFPDKVMRKGWELGLMNLSVPDGYGGLGLSIVDQCVTIEQIAWGCSGIATSMMANDLATSPITIDGNEAQKKKWLTSITGEYRLASFGLSEPNAGSDVAGLSTTYEKSGDEYVINGTKQWITNATYASFFTIFARQKGSKRHEGVTCFIVPRDIPGVSTSKPEDKMGQRASNTAGVVLENVRVPAENVVGKEGDGFMVAMRTLDKSRPMVAALCVGLAQAAMEYAIGYSKERKAFGQPIAGFQAVQMMIADMAINIEAGRMLVYEAASKIDAGERASLYSSYAKAFAADAAMAITTDAVQVYGGYGYTKEYPVEKLMRDAKLMQIYEGTSQIQRVVIARELMKMY